MDDATPKGSNLEVFLMSAAKIRQQLSFLEASVLELFLDVPVL